MPTLHHEFTIIIESNKPRPRVLDLLAKLIDAGLSDATATVGGDFAQEVLDEANDVLDMNISILE